MLKGTGSVRTAGLGRRRPAGWTAQPGTRVLSVPNVQLFVFSRRLRESPSSPSAMLAALMERWPERSLAWAPPLSWPRERQSDGPEMQGRTAETVTPRPGSERRFSSACSPRA